MAETNPPLYLEAGEHPSNLDRMFHADLLTPGVIESGHLAVTEQSTPALGVTVAAGRAIVAGTEASDQGVYYVSNDAAKDVALATADATNDRIDLLVARIKDAFYSGADNEWAIEAVTGTPAGSPVAPAAPANSLVLAEVRVPADAGGNPPITDAEITDERVRARTGGAAPGGVLGYAQVTADQTTITTETDLTGLSVTVDVQAGRRVRATYQGVHRSNSADSRVQGALKEGTTYLNLVITSHSTGGTSGQHTAVCTAVITPSSGSHTYKATMAGLDGTTAQLNATANNPAFILVEDIGPA